MVNNMIKHIRGFDGLRGISILFVILNHLGLYQLLPQNEFFRLRIWPLFSGVTGVNIFFVLSGFLITWLLLKELAETGKINFIHFFARRFLRLLPPLIIFFACLLLLMGFHYLPANYPAVLFSVFYLYNFVPNVFFMPELSHTWSLAVEEQFYFTWPFILLRHFKKRAIVTGCLVFILICILALYIFDAVYIPFEYKGKTYSLLADGFKTSRWFIPAAAPIIIGSMTAIILFRQQTKLTKLLHKNRLSLLLPFILFAAGIYLPMALLPVNYIFQALGIAIFLVWLFANQQSNLAAGLESAPLAYIGRISYGLYVYQGLFLRTSPGGTLFIQQFPLNIILTVGLAIVSFHFIEKRVLTLKEKFR
jgi:peptidoglycan/LPS O-acetylase OafA/YrhL